MNETDIIHNAARAMELTLYLSMPAIIAATVAGLLIGLLQALTSIQEQTLPHGIKLIVVLLALAVTVRWLGPELLTFAQRAFEQIPMVRHY